MAGAHKAIATTAVGKVGEIQVDTETPGEGEVLIKVAYAAMSPLDVYMTDRGMLVEKYPLILGLSAAGTIEEVGPGVDDLNVGDRVTSFAYRKKAIQEYVVQPRSVVAKLPDAMPLDSAATLPDNFVTAFYTLFNRLGLPVPSSLPVANPPPLATTPILVYGAGSTAGTYAVQLLALAGYQRVIVTASKRHHQNLRSLGATLTFDYSSPSVVEEITTAIGGDGRVLLAFDCISSESSLDIVGRLISPLGKVAVLLPVKEGKTLVGSLEQKVYAEIQPDKNPFPKTTEIIYISALSYQEDEYMKNNLVPKVLASLLVSGYILPSRVRLLDQGSFLERVSAGLDLFRGNKVSGEKVIIKVSAEEFV